VRSPAEAVQLVDDLPGLRWVKIGPMLYLRSGGDIVQNFKDRGLQVFLDLKWHDIPNSVAEAVRAARELGVDLATVHCLGGATMLREAVAACGHMRLAGVTVLTSHGDEDYWETLGRENRGHLRDEVARLAGLAADAGLGAIVASPYEVAIVRERVGDGGWIVTPGIRPAGAALDDQRRAADPASAAASGATHLVVGRPITRAAEPRQVYESLVEAVA
jgi:orotidine-5'-phosphate decarboxylase